MPEPLYSLEVGDCFEVKNINGLHLHFIVAEYSDSENSEIMLVYISSFDTRIDKTTILHPGEHPFITKRSWVRYQNIIIVNREDIQKSIIRYHGKCNEALLEKIQRGICKSPFTANEHKIIFTQWHTERNMKSI